MIFEAIPWFWDKRELLQKRFGFLTGQSLRLALARTRHEREFPRGRQGRSGKTAESFDYRPKLSTYRYFCQVEYNKEPQYILCYTRFPGVPFGNPWDSVEYSTEVAVAAKWVPRDDFRSNSMVPGQTETSAKTI